MAPSMFYAVVVIMVMVSGCAKEPAENLTNIKDPVLRARREKDLSFKLEKNSPLRDEDKQRFKGLDHFDLNPEYRFQVILHRYPSPASLRLGTNTEERREALRYGYFEFTVRGQTCRLQVYKIMDTSEGNGAYLFVPFRDATSGKETYGGGRYLDLQDNISGTYDLDFNRAYNPSCAYGRAYSCPVPPLENTLTVPILAGEKIFRLITGH